ncbi:hypothetical protein NLU13_6714 [Sarocladium strictum]|uniref:Uncharacterized protein n=1 Tax=Sarocladium strictum TaxID=5046 RepID=A0AA39L6D7_SARSR|nr:hypothetical protein NLU13_6714 [Sarocladium strictum]
MYGYNRAKTMSQTAFRLLCGLRTRDKVLLGLEFCVCLTLLVLFSTAYPDRYRTKLWENGGVKGWNSNPNLRIYFFANHKEPPEIPLIWTHRLTDSNLAIAILSFVVHSARLVLLPLNFLPLWIESGYDLLLAGLWTISAAGQASGDLSDPDHTSHHPWYLTRSCGEGWASTKGFCQVAQASFCLSLIAVLLYLCRTLSHLLDLMAVGSWRREQEESRFKDVHGDDWEEHDAYYDRVSDIGDDILLGSKGREVPQVFAEALSPVLAFFPEAAGGRRGEK